MKNHTYEEQMEVKRRASEGHRLFSPETLRMRNLMRKGGEDGSRVSRCVADLDHTYSFYGGQKQQQQQQQRQQPQIISSYAVKMDLKNKISERRMGFCANGRS